MRLGLILGMVATASMACVANSTPDANGYNVQLYFDGAPLGSAMAVGEPGVVTVKRLQTEAGRCAQSTGSCDPTTVTPIVLLSAGCDDDLCVVTPQPAEMSTMGVSVVGSQLPVVWVQRPASVCMRLTVTRPGSPTAIALPSGAPSK